MQTRWFQDLPPKEQDDFKKLVLGSYKVLDKLKQIVYTMSMESKSVDYDSPSWAFRQADTIGYNRAISDLLKLLEFKET